MQTLTPIFLDNGTILIHPLRKVELQKHDQVVNDLYEIFGDLNALPFNREKYVKDRQAMGMNLFGVSLGYSQKTRFTHFLTIKETDKIIGEIIILSPQSLDASYNLKDSWVLEFFLNKHCWNQGIMTNAIRAVVHNMKEQGIEAISALVDKNNIASVKVLLKTGFKRKNAIGVRQEVYQVQHH